MTAYTDIEIAAVAWAADAEFRALHGDPDPSLPGDNGDEEAHAVTLAGVRAIAEGATPEQLHETWRGAREAKGWTYGPRPDSLAKTHPSLVPWADLPERRRVQGAVFAAVVRAMAGQDAPELAAATDAERNRIRQMAIELRAYAVTNSGKQIPFEEFLRQSPEENAAAIRAVIERTGRQA